jgi:hypothetical protein
MAQAFDSPLPIAASVSKSFFNSCHRCLLVGEQRRLAAKRVGKQYMKSSSVTACAATPVDFSRGVRSIPMKSPFNAISISDTRTAKVCPS